MNDIEEDLMKAFEGECHNVVRYLILASLARKNGYYALAKKLEELSNNELEHAKLFYEALGDMDLLASLSKQANNENYEWTITYPIYGEHAKREEEFELEELYDSIGSIEEHHEEFLRKIIKKLKEDKVFKSDTIQIWVCKNCGHVHIGKSAPKECPVCKHPQGYFEVKEEV